MFDNIKERALDLQSRREHSRFELKQKLVSRGFESEIVDEVIEWLIEKKWQSDERFIESYVSRRMRLGYGPLRLCAELRARGIDDTLISNYVRADEVADREWFNIIINVWRKKFASVSLPSLNDGKQVRFLAQRGFTDAQISACIQALKDNNEQ